MGKVNILDCTLRDGGYLNDWNFGQEVILDIARKIEKTNVEMLELGFMRGEPYQDGRAVFNSMDQVKEIIGKKKEGTKYVVMAELLNPMPLEDLTPADEDSADIIRMILWKTKKLPDGRTVDALEEGYEYCKGLVDKGYKICIQPVRVSQYSDEEFITMLDKFAALNPLAIYVVDSWGTENPEDLLHYMRIADERLPKEIAIGYHGHNNMMQALGVAQQMIAEQYDRDIIIDASVYGVGRGAGNLNLELICKYMNEQYNTNYDVFPMLDVYSKYLTDIYKKEPWGYSVPFYLTAFHKANPKYARYLWDKLKLDANIINYVLENLSEEKKVIFDKKNADDLIKGHDK